MGYNNLAYQFEQQELDIRIEQTKKVQYMKKNRDEKIRNIKIMAAVVLFTFSAYFMISKYVMVDETKTQIATLQKQLDTKRSYTSQKIFELEQNTDLKKIEQQATSRLGMRRPEKYQTNYVSVKKDNVTEVTASSVEGLKNDVINTVLSAKNNITSILAIK